MRRLTAIALTVALLAAAAQIRYPLAGTPVPATLQTLVVMLSAVLLGPWLGAAAIAAYLLIGAGGASVFAAGGLGLASFVGPTGGYLVGFLIAQPVIGTLVRGERVSVIRTLVALGVGNAVIFGFGLTWLAIWTQSSVSQAAMLGFWPFVPLDLGLKVVIALGVGQLAMRPVRTSLQVR